MFLPRLLWASIRYYSYLNRICLGTAILCLMIGMLSSWFGRPPLFGYCALALGQGALFLSTLYNDGPRTLSNMVHRYMFPVCSPYLLTACVYTVFGIIVSIGSTPESRLVNVVISGICLYILILIRGLLRAFSKSPYRMKYVAYILNVLGLLFPLSNYLGLSERAHDLLAGGLMAFAVSVPWLLVWWRRMPDELVSSYNTALRYGFAGRALIDWFHGIREE